MSSSYVALHATRKIIIGLYFMMLMFLFTSAYAMLHEIDGWMDP